MNPKGKPRPDLLGFYAGIIFLVAFAALAWNIGHDRIGTSYSDPIARIRAQDEAIYVHSAIRMVRDGDWLTPKVMGRLFFQKPPLLIWLSAFFIRLFGLSLFAVRFPALLFGAAGAAAVFLWCARARSTVSGVLAAAVLLMSPFWQIYSRLCYTDILASSCGVAALATIACDSGLLSRTTRVGAGIFIAAGILSKSVAGLLPFIVLVAYYIALPRERRPRFSSILEVGLVSFLVAAPWHIYQLVVHPRWFWADYVQLELLRIGLQAGQNGIFNRPSWFYAQRLIQMDPVMAALPFLGLARVWPVVRSREAGPRFLSVVWVIVTILALIAFQAKNLPYIVLLLPALSTFGILNGPGFLDRRPVRTAAVLAILCASKLFAGGQPWSLRPSSPPLEDAEAMHAYYRFHREAELIVVQAADEFYSATLPLPGIRYVFLDPTGAVQRAVPYYVPLGITLTAQQFIALPALFPRFLKSLCTWGLHSGEPIGSVVTVAQPADLVAIIRAGPGSDFYVPAAWITGTMIAPTHELVPYSPSRVFLLSLGAAQRQSVPRIPSNW